MVYKGKKPVHWCIHCRTALAEAEVEYEDHTSPSIYVEFPFDAEASARDWPRGCRSWRAGHVSALIWTTTPWTIPSNLAARVPPGRSSTARTRSTARAVIVAEGAGRQRVQAGGPPLRRPGRALPGTDARRAALPPSALPPRFGRRAGDLRHARPGHGRRAHGARPRRGRLHHRRVVRPRDLRAGRAGRAFPRRRGAVRRPAGVRREPEDRRGARRAGRLWHRESFEHSYPHCWRCHHPVIFLATSQWFIGDGRTGPAGEGDRRRQARVSGSRPGAKSA